MDGNAQGFVDGLMECFADLNDPRDEKSFDHLLFDILAVSVLSVACRANDSCDIKLARRKLLHFSRIFRPLIA